MFIDKIDTSLCVVNNSLPKCNFSVSNRCREAPVPRNFQTTSKIRPVRLVTRWAAVCRNTSRLLPWCNTATRTYSRKIAPWRNPILARPDRILFSLLRWKKISIIEIIYHTEISARDFHQLCIFSKLLAITTSDSKVDERLYVCVCVCRAMTKFT